MKTLALSFPIVLAALITTNANASLLRCEWNRDDGYLAHGTFYLTEKCPTGFALENPKTGRLNCLSTSQDFSRYDGSAVDVCVIDTGNGLEITDMRPQGAE